MLHSFGKLTNIDGKVPKRRKNEEESDVDSDEEVIKEEEDINEEDFKNDEEEDIKEEEEAFSRLSSETCRTSGSAARPSQARSLMSSATRAWRRP